MSRRFLILIAFLAIVVGGLYAQTDESFLFDLNEETIALIVGAFGIGILGATQAIKSILKVQNWTPLAQKWAGYGISLVVSAGFTAFTLFKAGTFTLVSFGLYTVAAWGVANGIWKSLREVVKKHS